MDLAHTSTHSGSIRRKRNIVETGFLRTDDERAAKRSRVPSHADDQARPVIKALHFKDMSLGPSHHQTQQSNAHNTYTSQRRLQSSTQKPKNDTPGLGTSLLDRRPFREESDSDEGDSQARPQVEAREQDRASRAQPSREQKRAFIDTRSHAENTEVKEQMQNESYPLQRQKKRARTSIPKYEDHRSPTPASASPLATEKPKPLAEFQKVKNILGTVNSPRSHPGKSRRSRFKEDIDYPSDAESFTPPAPPVPPAPPAPPALQQSSPVVSNSAEASSSQGLKPPSREDLLKFVPTDLDRRVREWLHPGPDAISSEPMGWNDITMFLDTYHPGYILASVKSRQRMYAEKIAMGRERTPAIEQQVRMQPMSNDTIQSYEKSCEEEKNNIGQPLQPAVPAPLPPAKLPDATRLADALEKERLERQTREEQLQRREEELQQRIRTLEEESMANAIKLQNQEKERKLKAEVEGKYQKLKEEAQTQRERLRDEHAARTKAERELKQAQSEANRIRLAQAGSTRKGARAEGAGFAFPKDDSDTDRTPSKKRARKGKQNDNVEPRKDGHARTAGKSLPPASIQALYKHMNDSIAEEETPQAPAQTIQEPDLTYFVYTVHRKHWSRDTAEPEDEGIICGQFCYLNEANAEVTNEILRPHGSDGIIIDPLQDRSLHQGVTDFNMAWAQLDVLAGHVKVWVQRQLHTEFTGELPLFEHRGLLSRTVFAVRQEITTTAPTTSSATTDAAHTTATPTSTNTSTSTSITTEDAEIYTTFDLANLKASEKLFLIQHGTLESQSARYDDIQRRQDADRIRKQALEDLEDGGELFDAETSNEKDGGREKIRIWVVQKTVVGPRN